MWQEYNMDLQAPMNYPKYTGTSFWHWTIASAVPTWNVGAPLAGARRGWCGKGGRVRSFADAQDDMGELGDTVADRAFQF